ncbi:MAG TPA: HAD family phosphatase [Streptosporangiaceae bacterium]|jgi:putative hydrolase of the HAD superfamily
MTIKAIVFDIGGVLESEAPFDSWHGPWRDRLGLSTAQFRAAWATIDPDDQMATGGMDEQEYRRRLAVALKLTSDQARACMADLWDWYCGELDTELLDWAAGLRPAYQTALLSNSADGARREELRRYPFADLFDPIIYSHEVGLRKPDPRIYRLLCARLELAPQEIAFLDDWPASVTAASEAGIHVVLHRATAESIAAVTALLDR